MSMSILSGESWWSGEDDEHNVSGATTSSVFTVSTSHTTSSRKRRPGAAKSRLAEAKAAEQKAVASHRNGWQESIQEAAASNHRVWERAGGWLDYDEKETTENDKYQEAPSSSTEKIHIPLHVFAKQPKSRKNTLNSRGSANSKDKKNGEITSDVFFPVEWEKEGKDRQQRASLSKQQVEAHRQDPRRPKPPIPSKKSKALQSPLFWDLAVPSGEFSPPESPTTSRNNQSVFRKRSTQSLSPPRGQQRTAEPAYLSPPRGLKQQEQQQLAPSFSGEEITRSLSRSKGWVETMREATANLARKGHSWDPKRGFTNLDATSVSDVITIDSPGRTARKATQPKERQKQQQPKLPILARSESPANVLEQMIADRRKNDPPGRKEPTNDSSRDFFVETNQNDSDRRAAKGTQGLFMEKQQQPVKEDYQDQVSSAEDLHSTIQEQIEVIFKSGTSDPGKVRSYGIAALNFEEDEDYLLRAPAVVTPAVPVKKEKVGAEDLNLFPKSRGRHTQIMPRISPAGARARMRDPNPPNAKPGTDTKTAPHLAKRRSAGPVDVDDVGALSTASSDDTTEASNVWGSGAETDSFLQGSISSIVRRQAERETKADAEKRLARLSPRPMSKQKEAVSWAAHAKRLSQNVRGGSKTTEEPESKYVSMRDIIKSPGNDTAAVKADSKPSIFREKDNNHTTATGQTGALAVPVEIATDDASHVSAQSSVTAGWKSFLNKKVQAESATAAKLQEKAKNDAIDTEDKQTKIKKTVTFESDSHLSDSLLDSLFDFSMSDAKSLGSPERKSASTPRGSKPPSSPYRQRLNEIRERRVNSPSRDRVQAHSKPLLSTNSSFSALADSPSRSGISSQTSSYERSRYSYSASRTHDRSFLTDVSPLTHIEEKVDDEAAASAKSSFLKRLAECRAPTVPTSQPVPFKPDVSHKNENSKEPPVAYQWYLQSKQASEKVDEMMAFLRAREPISSCRQRVNARNSTAADRTDHSTWKPADFAAGGTEGSTGSVRYQQDSASSSKDESKDPGRAAEELARARVEAMVETLYYASLDEKKG